MEDQLTATLDRGWDLAQKGDAPGASACAKRALEIDPQSPEVHNLMGFALALEGDAEEALDHYRQAVALDETYFEAMLNAAEILLIAHGRLGRRHPADSRKPSTTPRRAKKWPTASCSRWTR